MEGYHVKKKQIIGSLFRILERMGVETVEQVRETLVAQGLLYPISSWTSPLPEWVYEDPFDSANPLAAWGPPDEPGFYRYDEHGRLGEGPFTTRQIRFYLNHKRCKLWVQNAPTQCRQDGLLDDLDTRCRWFHCPSSRNLIATGWLRVAFDEFPEDTTTTARSPFKVAMVMHLFCFEQCFDPVEFQLRKVPGADAKPMLEPELRKFAGNWQAGTGVECKYRSLSLERFAHDAVVAKVYEPWMRSKAEERERAGPAKLPRQHEDSLSYAIVAAKLHLGLGQGQGTRQAKRDDLNEGVPEEMRRTIDYHVGDLKKYSILGPLRRALKKKPEPKEPNPDRRGAKARSKRGPEDKATTYRGNQVAGPAPDETWTFPSQQPPAKRRK